MAEIEMTYTDEFSGTTEKLSAEETVLKAINLIEERLLPEAEKTERSEYQSSLKTLRTAESNKKLEVANDILEIANIYRV